MSRLGQVNAPWILCSIHGALHERTEKRPGTLYPEPAITFTLEGRKIAARFWDGAMNESDFILYICVGSTTGGEREKAASRTYNFDCGNGHSWRGARWQGRGERDA